MGNLSGDEVCALLKKWTNEEFSSYNNSNVGDLINERLCRGKIANVWLYVIQHLRAFPIVKAIRKELDHNKCFTFKSHEPKDDKCQKQVIYKLLSFQSPLEKITEELSQVNENNERRTRDNSFVQSNTLNIKTELMTYMLINENVKQVIKVIDKDVTTAKTKYHQRKKMNGNFVLSKECLIFMDEQVTEMLNSLIKVAMNKGAPQVHPPIGKLDQDIFEKYCNIEIMESLFKLVDERLEVMGMTITKLDLKEDLGFLKFHYKSFTEIIDQSRKPVSVDFAAALLREAKNKIIEKATEIVNLKKAKLYNRPKNIAKLERLASEIEELKLSSAINETYIKHYLESEAALAVTNLQLQILNENCAMLEMNLSKNFSHRFQKKLKLSEIGKFSESMQHRRTIIQSLIADNKSSAQKCRAELSKTSWLKEILDVSVLLATKNFYYQTFSKEMEFLGLLTSKPLTVTSFKNKLVLSSMLDINQTAGKTYFHDKRGILTNKFYESTLTDLLKVRLQIMKAEMLRLQQNSLKERNPSLLDIKKMRLSLYSIYQNKKQHVQSALLKAETAKSNWATDLNLLADVVDLWWNQDIGSVPLPYTIDDLNFLQWKEEKIISKGMTQWHEFQ